MSRRLVSPTLVGRESELAAVLQALDGALSGAPIHQLIAGEAGVGKSRLVREAADAATERGMRVLAGGCADIGDGGVPYGPIVEALRSLSRELDEAQLEHVVGAARSDLARLVPALGAGAAAPAATQSESHQARLLDAVLGSIQRLAEIQPVLLVVEDLHWADPATRDTIAFLLRQLRTDRVVLVMTFRADELHRRHPLLPWLAEVGRSGQVERLDLERLSPRQTGDLLASILGTQPAADLADQVHRRSDGNPFFIEELLMAGEDGAGRLPPTLREVLLARIVGLPEPAQAVIGVAAVAGRRVDHDLLARVAAMGDGDFLEALRTAVGSQVLVTGPDVDAEGGYAFRHALLQEAAYDDLLPGERQRLHQAFAEALGDRGPGTGAIAAGYWAELAYHWASARDDRRSFEASVRAGEAASRAFAFADARRHDERALELWSTIESPEELAGIDRVALLDRAAISAWLAGDPRRSVVLRREAVAELGADADPIRGGTTLEQLGRALWTNGESEAALEAHEKAVAIMSPLPPSPERARVLSGYGQILMLLDRWSESMEVCGQAVAMAREVGARQVEGHALNTLGLDLAAAGRCEEAVDALEEALAIAREVANADDIGRAYVNLGEAKHYCGDLRGAMETVRAGIAATDDVGVLRTYGSFVRQNGIGYQFELGDWAEASRLADESIATQPTGRAQRRYGMTRWVELLVAQGDDRAAGQLAELESLLHGLPVETQFNVPLRVAECESALWSGRPDEALQLARQGLAEVADREWPRFHLRLFRTGMHAAADVAEVARARRDAPAENAAKDAATRLWDELQPVVADHRQRRTGLAADESEAEVALIIAERARLDGKATVAMWRAATDRWRARERPYLVGYCLWREAETALREGDRAAAALALLEAHRIASALGAVPLRESIAGLATRSRIALAGEAPEAVAPSIPTPADPFGLTRRERDVLPLLVKGRTNRQIADELFISENTAGVHVSNILGKLGASTRTEAAGIAARLGLGLGTE